jgi:hypothetical protein
MRIGSLYRGSPSDYAGLMLRTLAVPVVAVLLAASCGGGDDTFEPSQDAIDDFCAAGLDLVEATINDPGGDDADDAFAELDPKVAEALGVRLNRLDPADNDDALDMADRFTDAGCDDDDFDALISDVPDTIETVTTVSATDPDDTTVVETTPPDDTDPAGTTPPGSTLPPSDLLIGVIVPAGPPPAEAIAEIEENMSRVLGDIDTEMQNLGMTLLGMPMYYPEGGYLFHVSADSLFGANDKVGVLLASDDPAGVLEAMVSFIAATDSFDRSDSSRSEDGRDELSTRLSQTDFDGPDYSVDVTSDASQPGLVRVVVQRSVFGSDDGKAPVPQVVLDALADEIPAAEANGQTEIDSWSAELGMSTFGDFATESFSIGWVEQPGDKSAVGEAICAARGYEFTSDGDFSVSCSSPDFSVSWSISEGFDEGTLQVRVFGSFS